MADMVMGAMSSIIPKLVELLKEEYDLQTSVKVRIKSLTQELEFAQAALCKVAEVPWDQLDMQVQIWARRVREASYDMEDVLDTFLVHVKHPDSTEEKQSLQKYLKKMTNFFKKSKLKARRKISGDVKDILSHLQEVTEQCRRYKVDDIVAMPAIPSTVDPRLHAMYNKVQDLVGIKESSRELVSKLQPLQWDGASNLKVKIVSIVGVGGLGKTTLAKAVYDEHKGDFEYGAFVPVGRNPDLKKILKDILMDLDTERWFRLSAAVLDERQLINELRSFLKEKRYFIVIDDIWEIPSWNLIKLAIGDDNNFGARIVLTTRKQEVAEKADEVYKLQPLPADISKELFLTRIGSDEGTMVGNKQDEVTIKKFLKKCAGIPLAIITMASLLAGKPRHKWDVLYSSIGFGSEDDDQAKNTMRIVSFSYYDLPTNLRTCLLYLSAFPEDSLIRKDSLVWMWVAEGFVKEEKGMRLFKIGEGYFHDLINRSMLEAVKSDDDDSIITGCRVHDMVLDFIRTISNKENFFCVLSGNDQRLVPGSNKVPRRLTHHDGTMAHGRGQGDDLEVEKVRSLLAIRCGIEASDPFRGFRLLRVLVIDFCQATNGILVFQLEHVGHLLHLRFLSIRGAFVKRIPKEIGRLRFLQTLDLLQSDLEERPSLGILPEQLVRLCLPSLSTCPSNDGITWFTRLTSLEELSLSISEHDVKWVRHLNKLVHLTISDGICLVRDSVLPSSLQHLSVHGSLGTRRLPSCINASCLPNLSHLDLMVDNLDEHDLKMLGMLPELRFLQLTVSIDVIIVVIISDKDAAEAYFPRLRCCRLRDLMVSCYANEEDKSISFHMWGGEPHKDLTMPSVSMDKAQRPIISGSSGGGGGASTSATGGEALRKRFMPCLEVLAMQQIFWNTDFYSGSLGLEYGFPSLREIHVNLSNNKMTEAIRGSAEAHPYHPVVGWRGQEKVYRYF